MPASKPLTPHQSRLFYKVASLLLLALAAAGFIWLFRHLVTPRKDFYNELWGPAWLLVHGQSPYATAALDPVLPAAWFPMAIGFFFPLGWLSEGLALWFWFIFNILALCALIYLAQGEHPSIFATLALSLFCFFFPPVLNHLYLGQISITVTFCLVLAVYFVERDQPWLTAFFIALALSKPHLAFLPVLCLSVETFRRGGLASMFSLWGRVILMSLALCLPLFAAYPNWIPDALASMTDNPFWLYPSLFVVFRLNFPGWETLLWGLTALLVLRFGWLIWKRSPLRNAAYWSLALAPLVSPYVGSWDFVVLLPLLFLTFAEADWKRRLILLVSYALAWFGMALVQRQPSSDNYFFWWVPVWFAAVLALVTRWKPGAAPTSL